MPFTMPNYPTLTFEQANPLLIGLLKGQQLVSNPLEIQNQLFKNQIAAQQAKYAPQLVQADIFSKEASPLATLSSNPYMWALMTPEQRSGLTSSLGNLFGILQGNTQGNNNSGINPSISNMSGGNINTSTSLGNNLSNSGGNKNNPDLLPGGNNLQKGAQAEVTAKFMSQPYSKGVVYVNTETGKISSSPSDSTIAVSQQALGSIKRVLPQLDRLSEESQEFLKPGGMKDLRESQFGGLLSNYGILSPETLKKFGIDPEKSSRYEQFQKDIGSALEALKNSFVFPNTNEALNTLSSAVHPGVGENASGYKKRLFQTIKELQTEQVPQLQQQLFTGFPYEGDKSTNNQPQQTQQVNSAPNMKQAVSSAIKNMGNQFKNQMIKFKGIDPRDGKMKIWNVPEGNAQSFIDNGYVRVG